MKQKTNMPLRSVESAELLAEKLGVNLSKWHPAKTVYSEGDLRKFLQNINMNSVGCWLWLAGKTSNGYGAVSLNGRQHATHRVAYQIFIGPIPKGLDLDHLCRNRACCNPSHLEAVSRRTNILRGDSRAAKNAAKTHCPKGHEYTTENTIRKGNMRDCRLCNLARVKQRYAHLKDEPAFKQTRNEKARLAYAAKRQKGTY